MKRCRRRFVMTKKQAWALGWGLLRRFPPFRYFPNFSTSPKYMLAIEYHVHIWQVSPQLSCGDTCQIWMIFKGDLVKTSPSQNAPWSKRTWVGQNAPGMLQSPHRISAGGSLLFMRCVSLTLTGLVSAWRRGEASSAILAKPLSDYVSVFHLRQCKLKHLNVCEILKKYMLFSNKFIILHS